jgi:SAM-dependent methyltransferase
MTSQSKEDLRFGFGKNWQDYVQKHFSDEKVQISQRHLLRFLKRDNLNSLSFLDIGCGSGLHSLAAWRSGAKTVISFDYDTHSVSTTRRLHAMSGSPENWTIFQGSVLDPEFLRDLPKADIVYSWGVLHHTGSMWKAIENAGMCLSEGGLFYIALYSKDVYVSPHYSYWIDVKRAYNRAGLVQRRWMEWQYAWRDSIRSHLVRGKNPLSYMREYKKFRGMSYWHDVKDWLGGFPMEFAGNKETEAFVHDRLGLALVNIKAGEGNTEFLFQKTVDASSWAQQVAHRVPLPLAGPYAHVNGYAWRVALPVGDDQIGSPERLMLYENGSPVGWPNAPQTSIEGWGFGRYRVDGQALIFSTTDNSDPNTQKKHFAFLPDFI